MKIQNENIASSLATAEQLEHRLQLKKYAEQKRKKALDNALRFRVGDIVLACWPCVLQLKVRQTKEGNETEFAPLREFLLQIATSHEYNMLLNEIATGVASPEK